MLGIWSDPSETEVLIRELTSPYTSGGKRLGLQAEEQTGLWERSWELRGGIQGCFGVEFAGTEPADMEVNVIISRNQLPVGPAYQALQSCLEPPSSSCSAAAPATRPPSLLQQSCGCQQAGEQALRTPMPVSLQNAHPWASRLWRQVALGSVFQALGCGHHRVRARTRPATGGHRGHLSRVAFGLMGRE